MASRLLMASWRSRLVQQVPSVHCSARRAQWRTPMGIISGWTADVMLASSLSSVCVSANDRSGDVLTRSAVGASTICRCSIRRPTTVGLPDAGADRLVSLAAVAVLSFARRAVSETVFLAGVSWLAVSQRQRTKARVNCQIYDRSQSRGRTQMTSHDSKARRVVRERANCSCLCFCSRTSDVALVDCTSKNPEYGLVTQCRLRKRHDPRASSFVPSKSRSWLVIVLALIKVDLRRTLLDLRSPTVS